MTRYGREFELFKFVAVEITRRQGLNLRSTLTWNGEETVLELCWGGEGLGMRVSNLISWFEVHAWTSTEIMWHKYHAKLSLLRNSVTRQRKAPYMDDGEKFSSQTTLHKISARQSWYRRGRSNDVEVSGEKVKIRLSARAVWLWQVHIESDYYQARDEKNDRKCIVKKYFYVETCSFWFISNFFINKYLR